MTETVRQWALSSVIPVCREPGECSWGSFDHLLFPDFADRSIRKHYAGPHVATLIVNDREAGSARFSLYFSTANTA